MRKIKQGERKRYKKKKRKKGRKEEDEFCFFFPPLHQIICAPNQHKPTHIPTCSMMPILPLAHSTYISVFSPHLLFPLHPSTLLSRTLSPTGSLSALSRKARSTMSLCSTGWRAMRPINLQWREETIILVHGWG